MRAIVTVIVKDRVGIIADVCSLLAKNSVNILDISQTVMQEFFTMTMLADTTGSNVEIGAVREQLNELGKELGVTIRIQSEEIFTAMHTV